jgi:hypothetical protein
MDEAKDFRGLLAGGFNYQSKKERVSVSLRIFRYILIIVVETKKELIVKVWQRVTT